MKAIKVVLVLMVGGLLFSCRAVRVSTPELLPHEEPASGIGAASADQAVYDLTVLSPTVLYAEVGHINVVPEEYAGRVIRMRGTFAAHPARNGMQYVCNAADAAGCCLEPMEFVLKEKRTWPDEYPSEGEVITVQGTLETYYFNEYMTYCRLTAAVIEDGE